MRLYLRLLYSDQAGTWRQEWCADAAVVGVGALNAARGGLASAIAAMRVAD